MVKKEKIKSIIHHEVHEGNEEKDKKMKNRQQLNYLQHQYIYCIYCKLLCLQYLQNLSSVFCHPSSVIADYPTPTDETFTYDANGSQIEETDASGQLLKQYIYNTENRLAEIKDGSGVNIATYYYDPFGRRLSKTITNPDTTTTKTYFHYNDEGLSAEMTNNVITSYHFNPYEYWSTNPIFKRVNNIYYYYHTNHLGLLIIINDKSANIVNKKEFSTFGNMKVITSLQIDNLSLPGQYRDIESGLNYNFHRYYNTNLGRYIQKDPIFQPNNQLYSYAKQNPQRFYDPLGLFEIDPSCDDCKFKGMWNMAQKACENAANNMSRSDFGAGSLKKCVKEYCKKAKIKCVKGDDGDCKGNEGYTRGYGEFVVCVDNTQDLNSVVTHEVCHLCDPDNQFNHGSNPRDRFEENNRRWTRKGCPL